MMKLKRLIRKKRFWLLVLLVVGLQWVYRVSEFRMSNEDFAELFAEAGMQHQYTIGYDSTYGRPIRFVEVGHDSLPLLVFIHGAPSSSSFWTGFLTDSTLLSQARLLAVDRPGYGYSRFGEPELSVAEQAKLIAPIIQARSGGSGRVAVHGSSYGGTVAARLAMDYPELVDALVLQSSSMAPGEEVIFDISYPTTHWSLSWLVPTSLHMASLEKLSHKASLEAMEPLWNRIKAKTTILHGTADEIIYPINADFAFSRLTNAVEKELILCKDRGHDLLWTERELLHKTLVGTLHWLAGKGKLANMEADTAQKDA